MARLLYFCICVDPHLRNLLQVKTENFDGEVMYFSQVIEALNALANTMPKRIFINIQDYPRHWKVLQQIIDPDTELVLYSLSKVDEKEQKKIDTLGLSLVSDLSNDYFPPSTILPRIKKAPRSLESTLLLNNGKELYIAEVTSIESSALTCRELPTWTELSLVGTLVRPTGEVFEEVSLSRIPGAQTKLLILKDSEKIEDFLR